MRVLGAVHGRRRGARRAVVMARLGPREIATHSRALLAARALVGAGASAPGFGKAGTSRAATRRWPRGAGRSTARTTRPPLLPGPGTSLPRPGLTVAGFMGCKAPLGTVSHSRSLFSMSLSLFPCLSFLHRGTNRNAASRLISGTNERTPWHQALNETGDRQYLVRGDGACEKPLHNTVSVCRLSRFRGRAPTFC